ncbi:hypothetical protein NHX12_015717 [Muraenolepis orangiensis]|uniref:B30.2/SPRY domain-containing protein n=1 Tax=Muraenolepis orangiensis TaxID=630683 RepID=A0A9Q0I3I0_9TELE|nr:hypothetical protein NHX12_015717 [Muraenolepis orangiensis]
MAEDVRGQIAQRASHFSAFSIACDESTDVSDSAQLLVFLRGVNEDFEVCQELAGLETLKGTTKGVDIFMAVERVMDKNDLKWETLSGITTDGAPAMVGNLAHFPSLREVGLMEEDTPKYLDILNNLEVEFDHRFEDFRGNTTAFELFAQPFSVNVDAVSEELQMELLELQSDSDLHSRFRELSLQDFYRSIPAHRYGKIRKHAQLKRVQQYGVEVTLDPDTAPPQLILSDDGKQVHDGGVVKELPDNPKRFTRHLNVLTRQSFSSGRFYFEVQVKDKTEWWLGVTRESVSRKYAITSHSPENGFWTVHFKEDKLVFNDSPSVRLPVRAELQKVGVFVDYDAGLVSFYDVEARAHIYSAAGCTFSEPLYPILSPDLHDGGRNSTPLIISPVNQTD